ncbi:MAG: DNA polymerase III subunit gamma/tau, partial [Proteobacteria bacterium]|nr:DNA polymerase III subunit gamma/tau [Pseudomonadota bacterium]
MAPTTLYNKWRPRTFADSRDRPLVGQEPVARTLRQAIQRQQVAHAYLFCGPRGTGKTSAARIFARAVNCLAGLQGEPCNRCANCTSMLEGRQLDLLVEIDAASNRGVEDARTLRDRLLQRPGGDGLTGRYKVYIIDEVHMLTKEAFNTLLKSLEEPPPHVIFILATTDPQEVLPTILSRCQRFDFRSIPLEHLVAHLAHVAGE